MKIFSYICFFISLLIKAPLYLFNLLKIKNMRFFNNTNNKIIGWYKGYPSYSIYSPPLFSKPAMNSVITKAMSLYQWRKLPEIMSIGIIDKCNCNCRHCSFVSMKKNNDLLTTAEIKKVIKDAENLGVSTIQLVGGEPLLNDDITEIIKSVNKELCQVIMFTNGYYLKEKAKDLKKAGLTTVIVSIDSADSEKHNEIKGKDGFFKKALEGIKEAKKHGMLICISSVVHKEDVENGNLLKLFDLSKKMKINEHIIFEALPVGNYSKKQNLLWNKKQSDKLISLCEKYSQKKNYPYIFPYSFLKSSRGIGCAGGVLYFYVSPFGDVCPCDLNNLCVGNIKDEKLHVLWDRFNEKNGYCMSSLDGCRSQKQDNYISKSNLRN